jgi:hypothetical protein
MIFLNWSTETLVKHVWNADQLSISNHKCCALPGGCFDKPKKEAQIALIWFDESRSFPIWRWLFVGTFEGCIFIWQEAMGEGIRFVVVLG